MRLDASKHARWLQRPRGRLLLAVLLLAVCFLRPAPAAACAPIPNTFEAPPIGARAENAIIIWDRERHLEHFIRNAVFDTTGSSMGFLVPVPGRPTLGEAFDDVFDELVRSIPFRDEGRVVTTRSIVGCALHPCSGYDDTGAPAPGPAPSVNVVEQTRVAGLDATVLTATDEGALSDWLSPRGFRTSDALKKWLSVYVAKKWYLVAFRYVQPTAGAQAIASRAVRITFPTDEPIYPYREPENTPAIEGRWLRLFVVTDAAVDSAFVEGGRAWGAERRAMVPTNVRSAWEGVKGLEPPAKDPWVTLFVDDATKRFQSDIVFRPNPSLPPMQRVDRFTVYVEGTPYVPLDLVLPAAFILWKWRRSAKHKQSAAADRSAEAAGSEMAGEKKILPDVDPGTPRST
jgi:hypothetical protein